MFNDFFPVCYLYYSTETLIEFSKVFFKKHFKIISYCKLYFRHCQRWNRRKINLYSINHIFKFFQIQLFSFFWTIVFKKITVLTKKGVFHVFKNIFLASVIFLYVFLSFPTWEAIKKNREKMHVLRNI